MTQKIFAQDLKQYDKIIMPASSQTGRREIRIVTDPELTTLTVNAFGYMVKNGITIEQKPLSSLADWLN